MQPKLFLLLAVVVLLAALMAGNPFLGKGSCVYPAVPLNAGPPSTPAGEGTLLEPNRSGPRNWNEGTVPAAALGPAAAMRDGQATPVGFVPNQPAGAATKGTGKGKAAMPLCPDPQLRPRVTEVEWDASGAAIWVLDDGRRLWRNPVAGKEPLLVPAPPRKKNGSQKKGS